MPGQVVGDGKRTVLQLVAALNRDPRRGIGFERVLQRLDFDDEARHCLAKAGLDESSVPAAIERWWPEVGSQNRFDPQSPQNPRRAIEDDRYQRNPFDSFRTSSSGGRVAVQAEKWPLVRRHWVQWQ